MILICGTKMTVDEINSYLPIRLDIKLENDIGKTALILKSLARSTKCQKVLLLDSSDYRDFDISAIADKTTFFSSDDDLVSLLNPTAKAAKDEKSAATVAEAKRLPDVEEIAESDIFLPTDVDNAHQADENNSHIEEKGSVILTDESADAEDKDLTIKRLREQLAQKDLMLQESTSDLDAVFEEQAKELLETAETYKRKTEDLSARLNDLELEKQKLITEHRRALNTETKKSDEKAEELTEKYKKAMNTLNAQIAEKDDEINRINAEHKKAINSLTKQMQELTDSLEQPNAENKKIIDQLKQRIEDQEEELISTINENKRVVQSLKNRIDEQDEELTKITTENKRLVSSLNTKVDEQREEFEQTIEKDKKTIEKLTNAINEKEEEMRQAVERDKKVIDRLNTRLEDLTTMLDEAKLKQGGEDNSELSDFNVYFEKPRALFMDKYTEEEKAKLPIPSNNIYAFVNGSSDSYTAMMEQVAVLVTKNMPCLIVDFTSDHYLALLSKIEIPKDVNATALGLLNPDVSVRPMIRVAKDLPNVEIIVSPVYHTLSLLKADWINIIGRLVEYAPDKPIIMLFDSVKDFTICHTIYKLSQLIKTYAFAKSDPIVLRSLQGNFLFCGGNTTEFIALNYITQVKPLLELISNSGAKRKIKAYPKNVRFDEILTGYRDINKYFPKG